MDNLQQYFNNLKSPTLGKTYDATISSSTSVSLATGASTIQVSAIDKGIFMKWGGTASNSDFDEFIPANTSKVFVIPTATVYTTVEFIEETTTAKLVVIQK